MYHYLVLNRDLSVGYDELRAVYLRELAKAEGRAPSDDDGSLCRSLSDHKPRGGCGTNPGRW